MKNCGFLKLALVLFLSYPSSMIASTDDNTDDKSNISADKFILDSVSDLKPEIRDLINLINNATNALLVDSEGKTLTDPAIKLQKAQEILALEQEINVKETNALQSALFCSGAQLAFGGACAAYVCNEIAQSLTHQIQSVGLRSEEHKHHIVGYDVTTRSYSLTPPPAAEPPYKTFAIAAAGFFALQKGIQSAFTAAKIGGHKIKRWYSPTLQVKTYTDLVRGLDRLNKKLNSAIESSVSEDTAALVSLQNKVAELLEFWLVSKEDDEVISVPFI